MIRSRRNYFGGAILIAVVACPAFAARNASAATTYYWNDNGPNTTWNDASLDWATSSTAAASEAWSDGSDTNTAVFDGTAGTVTLGATVNPEIIDFTTTGYTLAPPSPNPSNYQINIAGSAPTINIGSGAAAFSATINANVDATSTTAPLVLSNTSNGSAAVTTQLTFGGTLTLGSNSLKVVGNSNKSATFQLIAPSSLSLTNLTFTSSAANTSILGTSASSTITFAGANPAINTGESANTSYKDISEIGDTVVVSGSSGPLVFNNNDGLGTQSALSFGINGTALNNSFPSGIMVESAASTSFNSLGTAGAGATGTTRLNFNVPGANGSNVSGGAGPIYVVANGAIITNQGSQPGFTLNMPNSIYLNYSNITPAQGIFVTAIGCTKPNAGVGQAYTEINYSGPISGNGAVLIGNDLTAGSGGAGITLFSGSQKTYAGETIMNGSTNAIFKMGATNVLPSNTTLLFGYLSSTNNTSGSIGALDLNGYSQTIASLQSQFDQASGNVINGITNTSGTIATLTITGSTVDTYVGGIGISNSPLQLGTSNNNEALTRTGSGTTIIGDSNYNTPCTYIGDTNIDGSSTLEAAYTSSFSPNSNFIVEAKLDLAGWNNTINSLASVGSAGVVTTSQANQLTGGVTTLTIGSTTTLNAETAPVTTFYGTLQDGGPGMQLGLTMGGNGTQILAGANTYTGPTTVNKGTLTIASTGSLAAGSAVTINGGTFNGSGSVGGSVTVNSSGTLGGTLRIGGAVSVNPSGFIAPGSSGIAGTLTTGALTFYGGSTYDWKVTNSGGSPGTGYDTISASSITIDSSAGTTPISVNATILDPNFSSTTAQQWTIATSSSPISAPGGTFSSLFNAFTSASVFGTFAVSESGNNLVLGYTPANVARLTWQGGPGTWQAAGTQGDTSWNNGSSNGPWTAEDVAVFPNGSTGGIVTLAASTNTPLLEFDTTGYTIAAASGVTLTDTPSSGFNFLSVQVTNSTDTATVAAGIVSPLTKTGAGTLILTGGSNNTFGSSGGTINIYGGTLQGSGASLNAATINNNGTLAFDVSGVANGNYSGAISGSGSVVITDSTPSSPQTFSLSGTNNTYTGGTTINTGATLNLSSPANIGGASAGLTLNGGTLRTTATGGITTFGGALTVTANGGTITDSGAVIGFTGGASLASGAMLTKNGTGILQILDTGWTGSGTIVINGGELQVGDETQELSNPSTFLGGNSITLNTGTMLTIAAGTPAAASITPPSVNLNGNVTIALFNTGGVNGAGPLEPALNSATTISAPSTGGTITFTGSGDPGNALNGTSTITLGNTVFAATTGTISIQTVAGAGTSGYSTGVTFGAVTDNGDTIQFLGQGNNLTSQAPGPGVKINGTLSTRTLTGNWIIGDPGDTNAQIVIAGVQQSLTPQYALTTGNITVNPGSQLSLTSLDVTGANAYGPSSGTQTITLYGTGPNDSTGTPTGVLTVAAKAQEEFNSNVDFVFGNSVTVNGQSVSTGSVEIDMSDGSSTQKTIMTIDGPITGSAGLDLRGGDLTELIFAGPNNLTGHTTLKAGTLYVDAGSSIGTGNLNFNQTSTHNPTLTLNNAAQSVANLSSTYGTQSSPATPVTQTIQLNGTALTINETDYSGNADYGNNPNDSTNGTYQAANQAIITGTGSIIYNGAPASGGNPAAYLSLSCANTYGGGTTIESGTLATTLGGTLGSGPITFSAASGAAPALSLGTSQMVSGLANTTTGGISTLAIAGGATLNVAGNFSNTGTFRIDNVTAPGASSPVGGGTVAVTGNVSLAASSNVIVNVGTLVLDATSGSATISGSGATAPTITMNPTATLQLAGTVSNLSGGGNAANVNNNGSTASGGGLSVTGTNQVVGVITGTSTTGTVTTYGGDTVVGPNASLTATQILQNSLTIGAGATVTIAPSAGSGGGGVVADSAGETAVSASDVASSDTAASDPITAIQDAISSGSISGTTGQMLERRIAAIERLAVSDPAIDVALLDNRVLASLAADENLSAESSSSPVDGGSLLALDGGSFASPSGSLADAAFAPAAGFAGGATAVPEPSSWILAGIGLLGLSAPVVGRYRKNKRLCRS